MTKVRQRLLDETQLLQAGEEARRQRELKKFGKKVQIEKIQERQKQKTQDLEKIKAMKKSEKMFLKYLGFLHMIGMISHYYYYYGVQFSERKGIEDTNAGDDFDIALDQAIADDKPNFKRQKTGAFNKKKSHKVN